MKSSEEWWSEVKADDNKLLDWLRKQYHGEVTASLRIKTFIEQFKDQAGNEEWILTLEEISRQEETHAQWIAELLRARGHMPSLIENKENRYWDEALSGIEDWNTGCAVGAHAEKMRLERIKVISSDKGAPNDIRSVFLKILPQEEFHERAFREFSSEEALQKTKKNHEAGKNALGLEI